LVGRQKTSV